MRPVALDPVAVSAQQLQVLDIVLAAGSLRNDMIDLEDAKGKIGAATVAPALLLAEENLFVLAVRNWLGDVGAPGEQPVMQPVTRRLPGGSVSTRTRAVEECSGAILSLLSISPELARILYL